MTLKKWIRTNRSELDLVIKAAIGHVPKTASCYCPKSGMDHQHPVEPLNDEERRLWVLNDEGLYNWARSEGVNL